MAEEQIKIKQIKSTIGSKPKTRATMRALGLRRIGHENVLPNRPEIKGMIARVSHLVTVEKVAES
jgi:large subunit ribosomal protein L30